MPQKLRVRNRVIHKERKACSKRDRSQQTGEEVIKSSLTNPVELVSIKSHPPPPPPSCFSSSFSVFFAISSLSPACCMHFHSAIWRILFAWLISLPLFYFALLLVPMVTWWPSLNMENCLGFKSLIVCVPLFISVIFVCPFSTSLYEIFSLPYFLPSFPIFFLPPSSIPAEDDSQERPIGRLLWKQQTGAAGYRAGEERRGWKGV